LRKLRKQQNSHDLIESANELKEFKEKDTIDELKKKETQLLKERLILLRKVDHLERKLRDHESELRRLNSPTSATIQQIKEGMNR
jgi:predicted nucleotidyltransferase